MRNDMEMEADPAPEATVSPAAGTPVGVRLDEAIRRAYKLKQQKAAFKAAMEKAGADLAEIVRREIPNLFTEVGTSVWKTDGITVEITTRVGGTLNNAEDEEAAVAHLRELGFEGALQTIMEVGFTEAERAVCAAVAEAVGKSTGKEVSFARNLNPQTLMAWASLKMREGANVNLKCLGLSAWREAKLTGKKDAD